MQLAQQRAAGATARQHPASPVLIHPQRPCQQPAWNKPCESQAARPSFKVQAAQAAAPEGPTPTKYDVYVNDPKPLKEGESKHVISVFVADEAGLINRVAGVFARRGANIESLAVGLTVDKALFTIVVNGTERTVSNLVKQLAKLVKVRYVEDITKEDRMEREMLLIKVRAPPGPARTEVLQLAQIFRGRVTDVSDTTLTLCVTGDAGKCQAVQKMLAKFGILEIARTGRVCLRRGDPQALAGGAEPRGRVTAAPSANDLGTYATNESHDADVYQVEEEDMKGVWEVDNILEATYNGDNLDYEAHTLSVEVSDMPGVLNQVTGVFARRGYNVQSLAVGPSEREGMSRICMVVPGTGPAIDKLLKQLRKLVWVQNVTDLTPMPFVNRELMLVKVRCTAAQRGELRDLAGIFRADILDVAHNSLTIEIIGKVDKLKALTDLLEPYGILEIARTGRVAMPRESGVDSKYLESMQSQRVY